MGKDGIGHGVKVTMVLDGCTNTERAAVENTGIRMSHKKLGTRDIHIMGFTIALRTQSRFAKLRNHLNGLNEFLLTEKF